MNSFTELLTSFADAVQGNHGRRLAMLFTKDGIYEDGFFGSHVGRSAIAAMLQRFHDTGSGYLWEFVDPVSLQLRLAAARKHRTAGAVQRYQLLPVSR